jgi:5'-3' exonuclease
MKVALLDGYNLMHRSRFGVKGENSTVFTFFRSLRPLIEALSPDKVYLVLEGVPVHRQALDSEYKANRRIEEGTKQHEEMLEFRRQKRIIIDLLQHFPITLAKHPELECDDTIASLSRAHAADEVTIVSTDTDFYQLLGQENLRIYNPVRKEYVVPVEYDYLAWKALRGDKTDNVPSVAGLTDKAAEKLLANPQKLESFLNEGNNRADYARNLELIGFKYVGPDVINYVVGNPDWGKLRSHLTGLKFFSMTNDKAWKNYTATFEAIYSR